MGCVDCVIQRLCSLFALVVDPPNCQAEERREDNQTDDVAVYHCLYNVARDQVSDGGCHRGDLFCSRSAFRNHGAAFANTEKQTDHDSGNRRDRDHPHGDDDGLFHQQAHGLALLHVDDNLHDGDHDQRYNDHLNEIDITVAHHCIPCGGLGDECNLHRGIREAGHELNRQAQYKSETGADHDDNREIHVLLMVQNVDQEEQGNQNRQKDNRLYIADL